MNNYKFTVQYDGASYAGWQRQKNAITVQQKIEEALSTSLRVDVTITGSGRTDAGVHALGQVANFRTDKDFKAGKLLYSVNSILPEDISVHSLVPVPESFSSRFDAKKRSYIYIISKSKSPFYRNYSLFNRHIDEDAVKSLNELGSVLKGEQDFTSFSRKNSETKHNFCNIYNLHWRTSGELVIFYIEANRFLHGMVRTIVGTLLFAVRRGLNEKDIRGIVEARAREAAAEAVEAKGLFLYKVKYHPVK